MDEAFAVVAHPQAFAAVFALLLLSTAVLIELAMLVVTLRHQRDQRADQATLPHPLPHDVYDWLYE